MVYGMSGFRQGGIAGEMGCFTWYGNGDGEVLDLNRIMLLVGRMDV